MARSKTETREMLTELRVMIGQGKTDYECLDALSITMPTLQSLKKQLFSDELDNVANETAAENWVRYHLKMHQCLEDLEEVLVKARGQDSASSMNAAVGAVKAKVDIVDKVFARGQELGVIPTAPRGDDAEHSHEDIEGLSHMVREKEKMLQESIERFGVQDLSELDDPDPEAMYMDFGEPLDEEEIEEFNADIKEEVHIEDLTPGNVG